MAKWPDAFRPSLPVPIRQEIWLRLRLHAGSRDFEKAIMPRHHQNKGSAPGGSQRQLRVGETVRHAVADILAHGSVHDADLEGNIITVPEVRMSPDLRLAPIY